MKIELFLCGVLTVSLAVASPPPSWKESWFEHTQLLSLHYSDSDVAIYFDPDVDKSITWMNKYLHDVWVYTKNLYGQFGSDPLLYAIFHTGKYSGGHPSTYFDSQKSYRNAIDCGKLSSTAWFSGEGNDLDLTTHEVAHIVEFASFGVHNSPAFKIWGDSKWAEIFIYDVYLALGRTKDVQRWRQDQLKNHDNFPRNNTYWFRDWFLPIYEKHGGGKVLSRFFQLLSQHFPKSNQQYTRDMNWGEFVHFWSGAAKTDLKTLATAAFGWNDQYQKELSQAKIDFSGISYDQILETWQENWFEHDQLLTRVYYDDEVAIYFDSVMDRSLTWMNTYLNQVWTHTKKVYGDFGEDPHLYAIFHSGKYSGGHPSTYLDSGKLYRNAIDVGTTATTNAWRGGDGDMEFVTKVVALVVESCAHGVYTSPAYPIWGNSFGNIFTLDVLYGIGRTNQAKKFLLTAEKNDKIFANWLAKIYLNYGGSAVLNRFFKLLARDFPRSGNRYSRSMNHGELVHFWSGAAGSDLRSLARVAFEWSDQYENELAQAKKDFPNISY